MGVNPSFTLEPNLAGWLGWADFNGQTLQTAPVQESAVRERRLRTLKKVHIWLSVCLGSGGHPGRGNARCKHCEPSALLPSLPNSRGKCRKKWERGCGREDGEGVGGEMMERGEGTDAEAVGGEMGKGSLCTLDQMLPAASC